jgi:hypothetical protein
LYPMTEPAIYLAHSGDTEHLVNVLVKNRIIIDWDGNPDKRMYLKWHSQTNKDNWWS